MLTSFSIENYKSYASARLPLAELTMLIGANASGKSNLIEALQLISWLARGRRLGDVPFAVEKGELHVRGLPRDLFRDPKQPLAFQATIHGGETDRRFRLELSHQAADLRIRGEELREDAQGDVPLYRVEAPAAAGSNDLAVAYNNFARGGKKPRITCVDQQLVLSQLLTPARFGKEHARSQKVIPKAAAETQRTFERVLILDPVPSRMRAYSFPTDPVLRNDGSNLSGVLFSLCQSKKRKGALLELVRSIPEQDIEDIRFIETPRGEQMVELVETFAQSPRSVEAALLSDGTLRVLAVSAALLSAPEGSLVVIEEVDNGIHPSRAGDLLSDLRQIAEDRSLRVLLTTHNPALLDALPAETVPNVVFCYRDPKTGASRLDRLQDVPEYPGLVAQGPLGSLLTANTIDRFIKNPPTPEQKFERLKDFLQQVEEEPR
jgi:energy-coupling factor transporter ATP-binding protein EcfA2